ncbi:MAG: hypothetical protein Q9171_000458 [Xanthocarpia ochracea]
MLFHRFCTLFIFQGLALAAIGDVCRSSVGSGTCKTVTSCTTGFTVDGACPNDPGTVKCCIQAACTDNSGQCLDSSRLTCAGGTFKTGLCPGVADVKCCPKAATPPTPAPKPTDAFVAYIRRVHTLATQYGGTRPANQLVMEWLRHIEYNTFQWQQLIGGVDDGFTAYVEAAGVTFIDNFLDPEYGIDVKASHLGATMNGVFLQGQPSGTSTNRADVTGWGGDWMTFYGEWRRDVDTQPDGRQYCLTNMANNVTPSTFKLRDLIEDADGFNIGMRLRANPSLNIADEFERNFASGYKSRMKDFVEGRFGTSANAQAIARTMLQPVGDVVVDAGRVLLFQQHGGTFVKLFVLLSEAEKNSLTQGFADRLYQIVDTEKAQFGT